jgi:hypothetical protein
MRLEVAFIAATGFEAATRGYEFHFSRLDNPKKDFAEKVV